MPKGIVGAPGMVLITVCIAQFMAPLMLTAVGVALPSLGDDLGASAMQLGLIEQLYVVSLAMGMLSFGRYGDIVGQRRVFLPGLIIFTVLTCSLGAAQSVEMVMLQRLFQGLGACMMLSGSLAMVAKAYPYEVRGRKIGIVSACTYSGLSLGPVLGGFITQNFGWRYIFLMFAPVGLLATVACLLGTKESPRDPVRETMDWRGAFYYAVSVGLIMLGSAHAKEFPYGVLMIATGIIGLIFFFRFQANTLYPLLDINIFKNRFFTLSCLAALGNYAATFGITFMMSLYLQYVRGFPPRVAGSILMIQPVLQIIMSPVAGRLADAFEPAKVATIGMLVSFTGLMTASATVGRETSLWIIGCELILIGAGFGIFITPNSTAIMGSLPSRQFGLASGMIAAMRTLGMAVSMTTITLIFALLMGEIAITPASIPSFLKSMHIGLSVLAVFSCLGVILSLRRGKKVQLD